MTRKSYLVAAADQLETEHIGCVFLILPVLVMAGIVWMISGCPDMDAERKQKKRAKVSAKQEVQRVRKQIALDPERKKSLGEKAGGAVGKGGKFVLDELKEIGKGIKNEIKYGK